MRCCPQGGCARSSSVIRPRYVAAPHSLVWPMLTALPAREAHVGRGVQEALRIRPLRTFVLTVLHDFGINCRM